VRVETGTNAAAENEIILSLAIGDDGSYNIYGTDNRLVSYAKKNQKTSVTITSFTDQTLWSGKEIVTWKIPKNATMLKTDRNWVTVADTKEYITIDTNYHILKGKGLKEITYDFADIYSSTCVHNTIYCEVYNEDKQKTYRGSIKLTFGLTNTNGSNYGFNIIPERYTGMTSSANSAGLELKCTTELTDEQGKIIKHNNQITWSWLYGSNKTPPGLALSTSTDGKECVISRTGSYSNATYCYAILVATLSDWEDTNGNKTNLMAYYAIPFGATTYYITGASKIVYDYKNKLTTWDTTPYNVY
jgi:hypothetical protein